MLLCWEAKLNAKSKQMAEIKIEKKKPLWPIIILILIILAAAAFYFLNTDDDPDMELEELTTEEVDVKPGLDNENFRGAGEDTTAYSDTQLETAEFISYVKDKDRMGSDSDYTKNALIQLSNAVQAKAEELNIDATTQLQSLKQDVRELDVEKRNSRAVSTEVKKVGGKAVSVIEVFQQKQYPELKGQMDTLKMSHQKLKTDVEIEQQQDEIYTFFNAAGDVLKEMNLKEEKQ